MEGSKARTEQGGVKFTVKEYADGETFLSVEPDYQSVPTLEKALVTLQLDKGTSIQKAESIARFMNEHIAGISLTLFESHSLYGAVVENKVRKVADKLKLTHRGKNS